jgi:hypothetical protein
MNYQRSRSLRTRKLTQNHEEIEASSFEEGVGNFLPIYGVGNHVKKCSGKCVNPFVIHNTEPKDKELRVSNLEVYLVIGTSSWAQLLTRRSGRDNTKPIFSGNAEVLSSYHDLVYYAYLITINRW